MVAIVGFHGTSNFGQNWIELIFGVHPDWRFTDVMNARGFLIAKTFFDEGTA